MPNTGSRPAIDMNQPYEIGHLREGFPEVMGWRELVLYSDRTDATVRQMRGSPGPTGEEFPEPVAVLSVTPVYLASEVREYFDARPRERTRITPQMHEQIIELRRSGTSQAQVAHLLEITAKTVAKYEQLPL